jgi:predicted CXXCH cytochrome family protein
MLRLWLSIAVLGQTAWSAPPVCVTCHPKETNRFLASAMGRSIGPADVIPGGRATHAASSSVLTASFRGSQLFHTVTERSVTAEYPVALQIGRGIAARSYAVKVGDYLLESPLTWYKSGGWDVSPGFESLPLLDFERPVTENCLFCHADRAKATDLDGRRIPASAVAPISCDRCHGPGEAHVRNPAAGNIVNPAKLSGAARDSVCEQCHLEGETRVTSPEKTQWDFHPGDSLEQTMAIYLLREPGTGSGKAVTQVEELAESKCARRTAGKLWCGTCHDPHGATANRPAQIATVCGGCHTTAALSKIAHPAPPAECTSCHMPARPTSNVAHIAVTDHRLHRPGAPPEPPAVGPSIRAWREPPSQFRRRNLALAGLQLASERNLPELATQATRLLEGIPAAQQNSDRDVLGALEVLFLGSSSPQKAVTLSGWAVEAAPQSATFAMNHGLALMRAGKMAEAERELLRALDLDPSLMQAAAQLAVLYDREGRQSDSKAVVTRWLKWNPQSIQFRLAAKP